MKYLPTSSEFAASLTTHWLPMSKQQLLDRQIGLLNYLTDPDSWGLPPRDPDLAGIDLHGLRLEGQFSFDKRAGKILSALPRTIALLGSGRAALFRGFARRDAPVSPTRYDNAAQFCDYLCEQWALTPPSPPYLPDLAAFELALSRGLLARADEPAAEPDNIAGIAPMFRLRPGTELLRLHFDIRPMLNDSMEGEAPEERPVCLVIGASVETGRPRVFELTGDAFAFLSSLDGWTRVDRAKGFAELIESLSKREILEIRR
jgi:hypothetical protein